MYHHGSPTMLGGAQRMSHIGLRGSGILHPTMLKGMANSIGANTYVNTGITRTTNLITPGMVNTTAIGGAPIMMGAMNASNAMGEIPGTHSTKSRLEPN